MLRDGFISLIIILQVYVEVECKRVKKIYCISLNCYSLFYIQEKSCFSKKLWISKYYNLLIASSKLTFNALPIMQMSTECPNIWESKHSFDILYIIWNKRLYHGGISQSTRRLSGWRNFVIISSGIVLLLVRFSQMSCIVGWKKNIRC